MATYDHPGGYGEYGWDGVRAMATAGSTAFVSGFSHDDQTGAWDMVTAAFDATTGTRRWASRFNGEAGTFDDPAGIVATPDGSRVFVAGLVNSEFDKNDGDTAVVAYDGMDGTELWSRTFGEEGVLERPGDIALDPSGERVYVTGSTKAVDPEARSDLVLLAYDAASGEELWRAAFDGAGSGDDAGEAVAVSPDGSRVFVAATSFGLGDPRDYDTDIVALAYEARDPDRLGELLWVSSHDGGILRSDNAADAELSADGSVLYVAGTMQRAGASASGYSNYAIATLALETSNGSRSWLKLWQGPTGGINGATDLVVDPAGRVVVAGHVSGPQTDTDWDLGTIAYDGSDGGELWTRTSGFPRADFEMLNAVTADGTTIYATGFSRLGARQEAVTLAYRSSTGEPVWTARYVHGPGDFDMGEGIGVAGGHVVVAASLTDNVAFTTNPGTTSYNYADMGVLGYRP